MKKIYQIIFVVMGLLSSFQLLAAESKASATLPNAQQVKDCNFTKGDNWWLQSASGLPTSVANNPVTGSPEFCEFYQFVEDYFLYLISPSKEGGNNWNDLSQYPLLETAGSNSCDETFPAHAFNVRTVKSVDDTGGYVLPERIDQAGAHAIFDQNGNVVFYEVRFSKNLCDYKAIQKKNNFPGGTVEAKMAWKVLKAGGKGNSTYLQREATIAGKSYTLGLAGWHIVVTADNHPEMVWATLVHGNNAVVCSEIAAGQGAYPFTSAACAQDKTKCVNLNQTTKTTSLTTATPNDICQEFPYGTTPNQPITTRDGLNIALIQKLNDQLKTNVLAKANLPASLDIWKNYQFSGALWISDIKQNSSVAANQRGSLKLANEIMETSFQTTTNCFSCHGYTAGQDNTATTASLSHIFDEIIKGQNCVDTQTSQIVNNQSQAEATCPTTCSKTSKKWNGQWTNQSAITGEQLPMTVCGCCSQ